jgi:hypothetical protein
VTRKATSKPAKRKSAKPRPVAKASDTWPSRRAAAVDLSQVLNERITAATLTKVWAGDPTCPLPAGRGPIPKAALTHWAKTVRRRAGSGAPVGDSPESGDQRTAREINEKTMALELQKLAAQVANLELKNLKLDEMVLEIEDVRVACVQAGAELQRQLLEDTPQQCVMASDGKTLQEGTAAVREILHQVCERYAAALEQMAKGEAQ